MHAPSRSFVGDVSLAEDRWRSASLGVVDRYRAYDFRGWQGQRQVVIRLSAPEFLSVCGLLAVTGLVIARSIG